MTISRPTVRLSKRKWMDIAVLLIEAASEVSLALGVPQWPLMALRRPKRVSVERVVATVR